jgi:hypothetical protein
MVTIALGLAAQVVFLTRIMHITWHDVAASQKFGLLAATPFGAAYVAMLPLHLTFIAEGAFAATSMICCLSILAAYRQQLMALVMGRAAA